MAFTSGKTNIKVDVIRTVNSILADAISKGASDIHIEPLSDKMIVRYRIDGVLRVILSESLEFFETMLARIKVMSDLETTGLPRPQEGNIKFEGGTKDVDLRVSILPTAWGDNVVIRVLEIAKSFGSYSDLGFTPAQTKILTEATQKPFGLILVTGPNGSGKSTTLFTILNMMNGPEKSLATLEDPVERKIDMVRQTQINPEVGLTFADGLRYLLRQDPDVIMVGEIRDKETAQIAVEAAITGHLVLATIHTNDAAGAIVRLINMGVEPFLLASALRFISAQRLARMNCPKCAVDYNPPAPLLQAINAPTGMRFSKSTGCHECNEKGFKGRLGVHEILSVNKTIANAILTRPSDEQIAKLAQAEGMDSLRRVAFQRVHEGLISLEEALRLTE
jgi:type II secretory ATPase GspE/PulE/Tfp pilus assembly ATPase PilB-like protein